MSEELVQISGNQALTQGGVGFGAGIFRARPMMLELVQKSSRAENVVYGDFRIVSTNVHLGRTIRVVMLAVPQEQREWFKDKNVFSKDNKKCFSLDGVQPHPRALEPPAMFCKTCSKGDINWENWRKTKDPNDLPPCGAYWNLLVADRKTQRPYYLNVKGKSYKPFKDAMEQQMSGLMADIFANVRAVNKERGYTYIKAQNRFVDTPGFILPEGQTVKLAPEPLPNIFDISFDITSNNVNSASGSSFVMSFNKFAMMSPEDKAEFGQMYLDITENKVQIDTTAAAAAAEEAEAAEAAAAAAETPATVKSEVLPPSIPINI
jgi:hypothetical protein